MLPRPTGGLPMTFRIALLSVLAVLLLSPAAPAWERSAGVGGGGGPPLPPPAPIREKSRRDRARQEDGRRLRGRLRGPGHGRRNGSRRGLQQGRQGAARAERAALEPVVAR